MVRLQQDRVPRGAWTLLLLGVALAASALLGWQAYDAAASHRAATAAVLRDYAGLAAGELARRAASEVGYRGHYVLTQALVSPRAGRTLALDADAQVRRAAPLVRRTFTVDLTSRTVVFEGDADPVVGTWLAERVTAPREREPFATLQGVVAGARRQFVLAPPRDGQRFGYEVEPRALASFLEAAVDSGPLIPASLGGGRVGNERLAVVVRDPDGGELFRRGTAWSSGLREKAACGDAYAGALQGYTAEVEIDPSAAPALVIGGLPGSRVPQILALLCLAAGLLAAAVFQLRSERALARLRAEFVASASHELRTPLTQIRMFAETMRLGRVRSEEERQRSLEIIDREARRLGHLVENLLQFSRFEKQGVEAALQVQELAPLVAEVVESFLPLAASRSTRFTTHLAPALRARVDADAWRQILLNLLDNALKYGPPGQEVTVTLEECRGEVRLAVEDQGPGIPVAERERVFGRFHRLDRDRASTVTGTGLGLAVVRELASRYGGRCTICSARRVSGGRVSGGCLPGGRESEVQSGAESAGADGACVVVELPLAEPPAGPGVRA
jgi:signal transduction histidine kinase